MSRFEVSLFIVLISFTIVYSSEPSCSFSMGLFNAFAQIGIKPTSSYLQQTNRLVQLRDDEDDTTASEETTDEESDDDDEEEETGDDEDVTVVFEEFTLETEYEMTDEDFVITGNWVYNYDTDGDATLDSAEFEVAMADLGYNSDFADMCLDMVDGWMGHQYNDGVLMVFEVNALYEISKSSSKMQSLFAFTAFDSDVDGYITEDQWDSVEAALGDMYDTTWDTVDTDEDGQISVTEWQTMTGNCSGDESTDEDTDDEETTE